MRKYFALTERRSEEAKKIRREYRQQYGIDFSPRRAKVIKPREDDVANCVTATQGVEQLILEVHENETKGSDTMTKINEAIEVPFNRKPFTYVSLFSGIGGFEQALNKLGGTCVMASEIDKFANQSYELLYGHKTVGDITKVEAQDVPDHDILVGGTPCQSFSVAGKRLGFEDTRGTLFFDVARIAKEKQPKVVWIENVKGLVGHDRGRTLDTIVTTLNDIGYMVDFNVLNSKYFGVPQNRERIFIIALRDDVVKADKWAIEGTNVVAKGKRRIAEIDGVKTFNFDWPAQTEVTTRLRDVLEPVVGGRYYLSEEKTAKLVAQLEDREQIKGEPPLPLNLVSRGPESRGDELAYCLKGAEGGSSKQHLLEPQIEQYTEGEGVSCCLDASYAKGTSPGDVGKGRRTHVIETKPRYRIRKLTPLECLRLQGFPDSVHETLSANGVSNSQIYKQAGNAVTVNVIDAIGRRLLKTIEEAN